VIATDVGDVRRLLQEGRGGWLVRPEDAPALARAISDLVRTPNARLTNMGRDASNFVLEDYSAARLAERTVAVYHDVLA